MIEADTSLSEQLQRIREARHNSPYDVLGPHPSAHGKETTVRVFQPRMRSVELVANSKSYPLARLANSDLFEVTAPLKPGHPYHLRVIDDEGHAYVADDPYRFPLQLSEFDLYLIGEGTHYQTYEKLGAHIVTVDGVEGVHFAVWAPNAARVSVAGDFNHWDGRAHPMQLRGNSGIWELFVPGLGQGALYKYEIRTQRGDIFIKSDPYGFAAELRPSTASMVWDVNLHRWNDAEWVEQRPLRQALDAPISIYEAHLGSWQWTQDATLTPTLSLEGGGGNTWRPMTYRELAATLIPYVKGLGYTHIELMPVSEHPFDASWGYQTIGYYAPTSRFGTPEDFQYFVDQAHQAGLGVLLDWVPAHFPKDGHGLVYFDGTHLYEHADVRQGEHKEWGTLIFNYGRSEVRNFLLSNALFWLDKYHIDGYRVDAVSAMLYLDYNREPGEWIPNAYGGRENLEAIDFLRRFNELVHGSYPGTLTVAEESTAWPMVSRPTYLGGLGFSLKWNMGWMHDILDYLSLDPVYRRYHHNKLTFSLVYAFSENFVLALSHDEVVHLKGSLLAKMPGDAWQKFANLRLLFGYMWGHPGKKLLFMGMEFGQGREWNYATGLDWHQADWEAHRGITAWLRDLNALYHSEPALHEVDFSWEGFEWLEADDSDNSVLSFLRRAKNGDELIVVCNFTPMVRAGYHVPVPQAGQYRELLNSDAAAYWGSGVGNNGVAQAEPTPHGNYPASLVLTLPPLGVLMLKKTSEG
ncbi:MAG: 1,4-alpha-glucan branching enzyme [Candidatus Chloroheliales bacterium]|nr:MAG: 1,4-alpha-glucan branching enzyme [Chloroflexota bacterium]